MDVQFLIPSTVIPFHRAPRPVRVPAGDRIPSLPTSADAQYAGAVPYPAGAPLPTSALVGADGPFQVPVRSGGGASRQRASTWEPLAAGHRRMPRTPDGLVGGSQVEIGSINTVAATRAAFRRRNGGIVNGNSGRFTTPTVEASEALCRVIWDDERALLEAVVRLNTLRGVELAVQAAQEQDVEVPV